MAAGLEGAKGAYGAWGAKGVGAKRAKGAGGAKGAIAHALSASASRATGLRRSFAKRILAPESLTIVATCLAE